MPKYRISGPYWDGRQHHAGGSIVEFAEGDAPPRAKKVEEAKPAPAAAKPAAAKKE